MSTENENLKGQIQNRVKSVTNDHVKPTVLAPGKYAIDVELIPPHNRNNRAVHLDYLRHLKESVETLCEIVEEAKVERPLDRSIVYACRYTKHSQELLEYAIGTCPKDYNQLDKKKNQVTFEEQFDTSNNNIHKHVEKLNTLKTDAPVPLSTGVNYCIDASGSQHRVYYVEGLGHNLFSVGQFYDSDLEVAFRKHTCYVRDSDGVELIKGSCGSNLYTISVEDKMKSSPICLLSKASKNKSWLWHRRLNHLNFGTINDLARKDLVRGLPRLKFEKDHLCSFTWVKFLRSKDETPAVVFKFLKQIQVGLNKTVRYVRIDNGIEFVNKDLTDYYDRVSIFHQKTVPRTPQQNGVVERQNHTLVEAARIMLIFSKAPIEDLGKLQPTAKIGIFVGYALSKKGYRIYNKRTQRIMETIHVNFDELTKQMAPVQLSIGPAPTFLMPVQISSGLVPNPVPTAPYVPPTNKELEILFQPMFDEYMEPPHVERPVSPAPAVSVPVNSAGTPSSTTIDQDAPSPSHSPSSSALQSLSLHKGVAADSTLMEDKPFAPVDNHPFINVFAPEPSSKTSSSGDLSSEDSPYVS
ncbi:retrovirus-related pol polyprotein from transposon TNT 1-94 [Tanacetum coccineum]